MLEAHDRIGAHGMASDSRGGAYEDVVGLARGRIHAITPWPDQEAHEAKYRVANEVVAIYFVADVWYRYS